MGGLQQWQRRSRSRSGDGLPVRDDGADHGSYGLADRRCDGDADADGYGDAEGDGFSDSECTGDDRPHELADCVPESDAVTDVGCRVDLRARRR